MTDIKKLINDYNDAKKVLETTIKDKSKEVFAQFFIDNPEFRTIEWRQYTPSFNDGDPCEFTRGEVYYTLQPEFYSEEQRETIENNDYSIGDLEEIDPLRVPSEWDRDYAKRSDWMRKVVDEFDALPDDQKANFERLQQIYQDFMSVIQSIPDDVVESMYGNGAAIRLSKDGVQIKEYYHDY